MSDITPQDLQAAKMATLKLSASTASYNAALKRFLLTMSQCGSLEAKKLSLSIISKLADRQNTMTVMIDKLEEELRLGLADLED